MEKNQIKKELARKGYDFSLLADVLGKSPSLISKVAARQARSKPVALAICRALDKSVADVFPDVDSYQSQRPVSASERQVKRAELEQLLADIPREDTSGKG